MIQLVVEASRGGLGVIYMPTRLSDQTEAQLFKSASEKYVYIVSVICAVVMLSPITHWVTQNSKQKSPNSELYYGLFLTFG